VLIVFGSLVILVVLFVVLVRSVLMSFSFDVPPYPASTPAPQFTPRESTAPPPTAPLGGPGETLTTDHGVSITVETPSCYNLQASGDPKDVQRRCSVPVDVANDGPEQIKLSSADFALFLGETRYLPTSEDSLFFGVPRTSLLDPANGGLVLLWFDVAVDGGVPTRLEFSRYNAIDTALTVEFPPPSTTIGYPETPGPDTGPVGSTLYADPTYHNAPGFMAVTVLSVECGLAEAPQEDGPLEPDGEFCAVTATVGNETDHQQKVSGADFALIGEGSTFSTWSPANRFDGQRRGDFIEPGEVAECILWFDVPAGTAPSAIRYFTYGGSILTFTSP
jgi:hypothetical protein